MKVTMSLTETELKKYSSEKRAEILEQCNQIASNPFVERAEVYAGHMLLVELAPGTHEQLAKRLRDVAAYVLADLVDPKKNKDDVQRDKFAKAIHTAANLFSVKETDGTIAARDAGPKS